MDELIIDTKHYKTVTIVNTTTRYSFSSLSAFEIKGEKRLSFTARAHANCR
jgi:hypothetical protein